MPVRLIVLRGEVMVPSAADDEPDRARRGLEAALRRGGAGGVERVGDAVEFRGLGRWPVPNSNMFVRVRWGRFEPIRTPAGLCVRYHLDLTGLLVGGAVAAAACAFVLSASRGFGWWAVVGAALVFALYAMLPLPFTSGRYRKFIRLACLGLE
ncbi:MAG: hypothetical protein K2X87_19670 [Gemmataceae bacterium]|nr:hypothetical protein [Gemmataceae bacterium]